jgi:hypothetical protein
MVDHLLSKIFVMLFMVFLSVGIMEQSNYGLYYHRTEYRMAHQMCKSYGGVGLFWVDDNDECVLVVLCNNGTIHTDKRDSDEKEGRICK